MESWKSNWLKLSLLILAILAAVVLEVIQWKRYQLERYQVEQSAMNWALIDQNADIVGTREVQAFKEDFWGLFAR